MRYIISIGALALALGVLGSLGGCAPSYPYGRTYGYGYDHHRHGDARHDEHEHHEHEEHEH
jgi:hypothetical protein